MELKRREDIMVTRLMFLCYEIKAYLEDENLHFTFSRTDDGVELNVEKVYQSEEGESGYNKEIFIPKNLLTKEEIFSGAMDIIFDRLGKFYNTYGVVMKYDVNDINRLSEKLKKYSF